MNRQNSQLDLSQVGIVGNLDSLVDTYSFENVSAFCERILIDLKRTVERHNGRHINSIINVANSTFEKYNDFYQKYLLDVKTKAFPLVMGDYELIVLNRRSEEAIMKTMSKMAGIMIRYEISDGLIKHS